MKSYKKIIILSALLGASANAASVAISNGGSIVTLTAIARSNSTLAGGGIVAAGYFGTLTDAQVVTLSSTFNLVNLTLLRNDFQIVGTTTLDSDFADNGIYSGDFVGVTLPNATLAGNRLYSFLGNAATLAASTEIILWQHTDVINSQDTIVQPDSNSLVLGQEGMSLISGGTFASSIDFDGPGGDAPVAVNAIRLAAIPEPSSMLLGAIGALALLRRKR